MPKSKVSCSNLAHPSGEPSGQVIRETARATYVECVCPVCHKPTGIRRIIKSKGS